MQRLWLQDAECTSILFVMDRKAAGRLGLTELYFAIYTKFDDARNRKTVLLSR